MYDFILWLLPIVGRFPQSQRFLIGGKICDMCFGLLGLIISANQASGVEREKLQKMISEKMDCLRLTIRLAKDMHLISIKQYAQAAERMNEMGRMFQAWQKIKME